MQDAINKAASLADTHQYVRTFKDKVIVVKAGGSIIDRPEDLRSVVSDICYMSDEETGSI